MNILIYGAGAIGCHIGYCLYKAGHQVKLLCRGEHFTAMKQDGMNITICDNEHIITETTLRDNKHFQIIDQIEDSNDLYFDYVFVTVKLKDYNNDSMSALARFLGESTAVIPPCTKLPFWWFYNLSGLENKKFKDVEFDPGLSGNFIKTNLISMTMWVSAVLERPGHIIVRHVQRGYPVGAVHPNMIDRAETLRDIFQKICGSPVVEDIRSEIYIKSINALAFNMVAIDTEFTNLEFSKDPAAKECVEKIMLEGDQILKIMNIPVIQSIGSRIEQTLSSTKHTLSMLHDYNTGKEVELKFLWDGFDKVTNILGIEMPYTRALYERVKIKIDARSLINY